MVLPLLCMLALITLGMPIAFAMLIPTAFYFGFSGMPDIIFVQRFVSGTESFPLLSIPFFVLAGDIMHRGGIARRLLHVVVVAVGHMRGGMAQVAVLGGALVSAVSGSATADTAILAKTVAPEMIKEGYPKGFAAVVSAVAGVLGPMIPPSITLILYGLVAEVSIGRLFAAGIIPGLVIAVFLLISNAYVINRHNFPIEQREKASWGELASAIRKGFWALLFPVLIWVGLRIGFLTPTELGAFVAVYCLVISLFVYKEISIRDLPGIFQESALLTAIVLFILASSGTLNYAVSWERLPQSIADGLLSITENKILILLMINVLLLILGTFMEGPPLLILLTPMLAPVMTALGVDLVHFGIILTFNLTLGAITPPVATLNFVAMSIVGCKAQEFMRYFWPVFIAMCLCLMVITYIPQLSLVMPDLLFGRTN